jgi:hypothetical protein
MKTFRAKYDGRCAGCGGAIHAGEMIAWTKQNGKGVSFHINCQPGNQANGNGEPAPVDDENAAHKDYLEYCEYYKDEPDFF